jgi:outer membrane protein
MTSSMKKRMFYRLIALITTCVLLPGLSVRAAGEAQNLSLKESISIALEQSLSLKGAQEEIQASAARKDEAFTNFLPKLSTSYNYTHLNKDPWFPLMGLEPLFPDTQLPAGTKDNFTWAFEIRQPVFTGGAILESYKASVLGVDVANYEEQSRRLDVVEQVKIAYYNVLKAEHILEVTRQAVNQLKAHCKTVKDFFDQEMVPRNDLLYVGVELANGMKTLLKAENGVEMAKSQFNTVLRRHINTPVELEDVSMMNPFEPSLDECLKTAEGKRPEIKAAELKVTQAGHMVEVARSEYYPTVSALGHFERFGDDPSLKGSDFKDKEGWYVAAVANWNFWEWDKTGNRVQAGKAMRNEAGYALSMLKDQIRLEAKNAYLDLQDARKQVDVARQAMEQAEENYRITLEHYREQIGTNTEVLDAQTLLTKTRTDYVNAQSDYNVSYARLERTLGIMVVE